MIQRVAVLLLRIELMDRKSMQDMSEKNTREYLCWVNAASRLLRQLGLQGVPERPPSLAELMASPITPTGHSAPRQAA